MSYGTPSIKPDESPASSSRRPCQKATYSSSLDSIHSNVSSISTSASISTSTSTATTSSTLELPPKLAALLDPQFSPHIYNTITFAPERERSSIVTYSQSTPTTPTPIINQEGDLAPNQCRLSSATVERLVAHLTSHDILDYNMMSDFFFTFRMFISAEYLLKLLISRFYWAVNYSTTTTTETPTTTPKTSTPTTNGSSTSIPSTTPTLATSTIPTTTASKTTTHNSTTPTTSGKNEVGRDISVRTFIVLRYWLLNFFPDDFVPSLKLRTIFADAINCLESLDVINQDQGFTRIIQQLKRCWIKMLSLYWDLSPDSTSGDENSRDANEAVTMESLFSYYQNIPLIPGGEFGTRSLPQNHPLANDAKLRRKTLLLSYRDEIKPIYSNEITNPTSANAITSPTTPTKKLKSTDLIPMTGQIIRGAVVGVRMGNSGDTMKRSHVLPPTPTSRLTKSSPIPPKLDLTRSNRNFSTGVVGLGAGLRSGTNRAEDSKRSFSDTNLPDSSGSHTKNVYQHNHNQDVEKLGSLNKNQEETTILPNDGLGNALLEVWRDNYSQISQHRPLRQFFTRVMTFQRDPKQNLQELPKVGTDSSGPLRQGSRAVSAYTHADPLSSSSIRNPPPGAVPKTTLHSPKTSLDGKEDMIFMDVLSARIVNELENHLQPKFTSESPLKSHGNGNVTVYDNTTHQPQHNPNLSTKLTKRSFSEKIPQSSSTTSVLSSSSSLSTGPHLSGHSYGNNSSSNTSTRYPPFLFSSNSPNPISMGLGMSMNSPVNMRFDDSQRSNTPHINNGCLETEGYIKNNDYCTSQFSMIDNLNISQTVKVVQNGDKDFNYNNEYNDDDNHNDGDDDSRQQVLDIIRDVTNNSYDDLESSSFVSLDARSYLSYDSNFSFEEKAAPHHPQNPSHRRSRSSNYSYPIHRNGSTDNNAPRLNQKKGVGIFGTTSRLSPTKGQHDTEGFPRLIPKASIDANSDNEEQTGSEKETARTNRRRQGALLTDSFIQGTNEITQRAKNNKYGALTNNSRNNVPPHDPHYHHQAAFPGVMNADAVANLATIPDDTPEEDAINVALQKLEGTYVKQSLRRKPRPTYDDILKNPPITKKTPIRSTGLSPDEDFEFTSETSGWKYAGSISDDSRVTNNISHSGGDNSHDNYKKGIHNDPMDDSIDVSFVKGITGRYSDISYDSKLYGDALDDKPYMLTAPNDVNNSNSVFGLNIPDGATRGKPLLPSRNKNALLFSKKLFSNLVNGHHENKKITETTPIIPENSVQMTMNNETNLDPVNEDRLSVATTQAQVAQAVRITETSKLNVKPHLINDTVSQGVSQGVHLPFILTVDSETLIQQMTLIERDALAEVDWKELIELRWDQKFDPIQSWLSFLINHRIRGIELVISRFNLMVNWVISEILLTRSQADRERVISKFIHVAARARQYQNFATMMQIVLALSSGKIQCLSRTWKQVSRENMTLLTELERLVIPFKNFQNLRAELNALNPAVGCIPFVGLYLSDLTFNAERPSHVTRTDKGKKPHTETAKTSMSFTTRNSETARSSSVSSARSADSTSTTTSIPSTASEESLASTTLINFDRFRTSASIVRSLIQCIEWSKHYTFEPNDDIVAKCLYICSLTSDEMEKCHEYLIDP